MNTNTTTQSQSVTISFDSKNDAYSVQFMKPFLPTVQDSLDAYRWMHQFQMVHQEYKGKYSPSNILKALRDDCRGVWSMVGTKLKVEIDDIRQFTSIKTNAN